MKFSILVSIAALALLALPACTTAPRLGAYDSPARRPSNPDNVKVKVSLSKQQVYVMEGDRPLLVTATCVGTRAKPTPRGNFRVYKKIEHKRSGSYGFWVKGDQIIGGSAFKRPGSGYRYVGYPMPYWVEFSPLYGFHSGYVHPIPKTHGCLRLHEKVAPKFYALVKNGTPVSIADSQPEDQTIGANVPRPSDWRDPDPPASHMISAAVFKKPAGSLFVD